jgi:hypothetical protein
MGEVAVRSSRVLVVIEGALRRKHGSLIEGAHGLDLKSLNLNSCREAAGKG